MATDDAPIQPELMRNGLPPAQGLYDPQFESDACGVGFIVNIKGIPSHKVSKLFCFIIFTLSHSSVILTDTIQQILKTRWESQAYSRESWCKVSHLYD